MVVSKTAQLWEPRDGMSAVAGASLVAAPGEIAVRQFRRK